VKQVFIGGALMDGSSVGGFGALPVPGIVTTPVAIP
jgi:hypothetical protein